MKNAVINHKHLTPKGIGFIGHKKERVSVELEYNTSWAKLIHRALRLEQRQLALYLFMRTFTARHATTPPTALTTALMRAKPIEKELTWAIAKAQKETDFSLFRTMLNKLVMLAQRSIKSKKTDWSDIPLTLVLESDERTVSVNLNEAAFIEYCEAHLLDFAMFRSLARAQNLELVIKHTGRVFVTGEVYV